MYNQMKALQNHCDPSVRKYCAEVVSMAAEAISAHKQALKDQEIRLEAKRKKKRPADLLALMENFEQVVKSAEHSQEKEKFHNQFNRYVGRLRQFEGITADLLVETRAGKRLTKLTKLLKGEYLEQVRVIIKAWKLCARKTLSPQKRSGDAITKALRAAKRKKA